MFEETRFGWPLASVCLFGWVLATTYTNHAPLIPVFMERLGFTPTEAGLLSLAFFVSMAAVSLPAGLLSDRFGSKQIATVGLAITGVSNAGLGCAGFAQNPLVFQHFLCNCQVSTKSLPLVSDLC